MPAAQGLFQRAVLQSGAGSDLATHWIREKYFGRDMVNQVPSGLESSLPLVAAYFYLGRGRVSVYSTVDGLLAVYL
ncbi:hypothetical protein Krac_4999 [Ktedonobacter racemifer DSM 44963]|uniref:Uncharacterized protein n=1 Tax=Ktedonobacter racemifer DSM 44963 TaxID=485913 RepID=D6TU92_KTERA|nr:hypothetical protein Krac_4999 [Ktedonobacter racemifer DSM 44963]